MLKARAESSRFVQAGGAIALDGEACVDVIRSALAKNADLRLLVRGFSMTPFIQDGDIITLSSLPASGIGIGRAVAFSRPSDKRLVIHRLVGILRKPAVKYITKGDNVYRQDIPVSRSDMLAFVLRVERGGRILSFGTGPERRVIAFLSKWNILWALTYAGGRMIPRAIRQKMKQWLFF
ncbi:MAG: hypothetical protein WCY10_02900 [Candidatus Omnitrophota bacterium]